MSALVRTVSSSRRRSADSQLNPGSAYRRRVMRRSIRGRVPRLIAPNVHVFERMCSFVLPVYSTTGWANYPNGTTGYGTTLALTFCLAGVNINIGSGTLVNSLTQVALPSAAEFTALFDVFQIKRINIKCYPMQTLTQAPGIQNTNLNVLYSCLDYDDQIPSTLTALQQFSGVKMDQPGNMGIKLYNHSFTPKPLIQLYETSTSTGYGIPDKPVWIDCNDATTPHYGWKIGMDLTNQSTLALLGAYNFVVKYTIACKGSR